MPDLFKDPLPSFDLGGLPKPSGAPEAPKASPEALKQNLLAVLKILKSEKGARPNQADLQKLFGGDEVKVKDYLDKLVTEGYLITYGKKAIKYALAKKGLDFLDTASTSPAALEAAANERARKTAEREEEQKELEGKRDAIDRIKAEGRTDFLGIVDLHKLEQRVAAETYEFDIIDDNIKDDSARVAVLEKTVGKFVGIADELKGVYQKFSKDPKEAAVLKQGVLADEVRELVRFQEKIDKFLNAQPPLTDDLKKKLNDQRAAVEARLDEYVKEYGFLVPGKNDAAIEKLNDEIFEKAKEYRAELGRFRGLIESYKEAVEGKNTVRVEKLFDLINESADKCFTADEFIKDGARKLGREKSSAITNDTEPLRREERALRARMREIDIAANDLVNSIEPLRAPIEKELAAYPPILNEFELAIDRYEDAIRNNDSEGLRIARGDDGHSGELGAAAFSLKNLRARIKAVGNKRTRDMLRESMPQWNEYVSQREALFDRLKSIDAAFKAQQLLPDNRTMKLQVGERMRVAGDSALKFKDALNDAATPLRLRFERMAEAFESTIAIAEELVVRNLKISDTTKAAYDKLLAIKQAGSIVNELKQPAKRKEIDELLASLVLGLNTDQEIFFKDPKVTEQENRQKNRIEDQKEVGALVAGLDSSYAELFAVNNKYVIEDDEKEKKTWKLKLVLNSIFSGAELISNKGITIEPVASAFLKKLREAYDAGKFVKGNKLSANDLQKLQEAILSIKESARAFFDTERVIPLGEKDLENEHFKEFFPQFDAVQNPGVLFETVPADQAQERLNKAREAFDLLQKAILVFSRFTKDRVQQGLGRQPEAADYLAANAELERMAIEHPDQLKAMLEKMEMFIMPAGAEAASSAPKIEESIARLENTIQDEMSEADLEKLRDELFDEKNKLTTEKNKLSAKSDDQYKEALFQLAADRQGRSLWNRFKKRSTELIGLSSDSLKETIKTKYGLTIKEAADSLKQAKLQTKAFNDEMKAATEGLKEVTEQYERIRQRIVDLETATQEKRKLERQFAYLKSRVIRNSKIFGQVASTVAQRITQDVVDSVSADPTIDEFVAVSDQVRGLGRASDNHEYFMNVPEVATAYSAAARGFVPKPGNVAEALYLELGQAVEKSIEKAAWNPVFDTGVIADLEKTMKAYPEKGRAIINLVLDRQIKQNLGTRKAVMLRAIQIRLNKKP